MSQVASRMSGVLVAGVSWLAAATAAAQGEPACYYTYTPIPIPQGWISNYARSINNHGEVAGLLGGLGDNQRAYVWSQSAGLRILPLPAGIISMESAYINDHGVVAGAMVSSTTWYGYVWDGATYTTITLPAWANSIYVRGINNAGQVVGTVYNGQTGPFHVFIWQDGVMTELNTIIGRNGTNGEDINDLSIVAGYSGADAFLLRNLVVTWLTEPDFPWTEAYGLSRNDYCAGMSLTGAPTNPQSRVRGAYWRPDGTLESVAPPQGTRHALLFDVNDSGRAVGYYYGGVSPVETVITWQSGVATQVRSLTSPPISWRILWGWDINQSGQIAAYSDQGAALLTPHWLPGDLTGDCHVTLDDLALVLANFGSPAGTYPLGDVDLDGDVDLIDLATLLVHFGE